MNSVLRPASPLRHRATSPLAVRPEFGAVSVGFASTCEKFIMFRSFFYPCTAAPCRGKPLVRCVAVFAPDAAQKKSAAGSFFACSAFYQSLLRNLSLKKPLSASPMRRDSAHGVKEHRTFPVRRRCYRIYRFVGVHWTLVRTFYQCVP